MEALFSKYFWAVKGVGLAIVAGLAASAGMTLIGTEMVLDVPEPGEEEASESDGEDEEDEGDDLEFGENPFRPKSSSSLGGSSNTSMAKTKAVGDIKKRNIFCPTCVPAVPDPNAGVALNDPAAQSVVGIQPGEVKSKLPLQLMATMEAFPSEHSLATVYDAENHVTGLYGLNDAIRPGVLVLGVDAGVVHIRNNSALEYIQLGEQIAVAEVPAAEGEPKKEEEGEEKPKSDSAIEGAEDAINCPSENLCIVERAFVESLMSNPAALAKQARIVPSQKDGETQGFKFYGIRRGSLPKLLGLKNGDMLTEVNGEEIKSVDQAMSLAMKLRRATNLSVTLVRKGQPMTKEIQIQ
jgi:type II secretion system protein C